VRGLVQQSNLPQSNANPRIARSAGADIARAGRYRMHRVRDAEQIRL
jgi:hypothetical protein